MSTSAAAWLPDVVLIVFVQQWSCVALWIHVTASSYIVSVVLCIGYVALVYLCTDTLRQPV